MSGENHHKRIMVSPGALLIGCVAMLTPWATYLQLAPFTTPVTVTAFLLGALTIALPRKGVDYSVFLFLLYIGLLILSWTWTVDSEHWFNAVFWWFICFVCFAATIRFIRTPEDIRDLVYLSVLGALIAGLKLQVLTDDWGNVSSRLAVHGHNMNFTSYALSGVVVLSLASVSFLAFPLLFRRVLPFVIAAILYFQMQLGTRGALIASVAIIVLHVFRRSAPLYVMQLIPVLATVATVYVSFGFGGRLNELLDSFAQRGNGDLSGRGLIWAEAFRYISDNPVFGIGPSSFAQLNITGAGAHNFFLVIPLETGIVGTLIFLLFFLRFFRLFIGFRNRRVNSYLVGAFSAYWFPLAGSGHWETSPYSWIVVAAFIRMSYLCREIE